MSNEKDFVIENGVLIKYTGEDTAIVIPDGVKTIERCALDWKIKEITIPPSVKKLQVCSIPREAVVYGQEGSAADLYVQKNGGTFVAISRAEKKPLVEPDGKVSPLRAVALLENAILERDVERVSYIVKEYAPFELGARALGLACRNGCMDIVSYLVKNKFNFTYTATNQKLTGKYGLIYKPSSVKFQADFALLAVVSDIWNRYLFGHMEKSFPPEKMQIGWDPDLGCEKVLSPISPEMSLGSSEDRAKVLEYLCAKKKISDKKLNLLLYYAILEDDAVIVNTLGALGGVVDVVWLDAEKRDKNNASEFKRFLVSVAKKDTDAQKRIFCNLNKYMKLAHCKLGLWDSFFEKIPCFKDAELAKLVLENADISKINKRKCLLALVTPETDPMAIEAFLEAGFFSDSQIDELLELSKKYGLTDHQVILNDYKKCGKTANKDISTDCVQPEKDDSANALFSTKTIDDGTLCITNYKGAESSVNIPAQIGGIAVSAIGDHAFSPEKKGRNLEQAKFCLRITDVTIPDGIEKISRGAFSGCKNLSNIILPESINKIGADAFANCNKLEHVNAASDNVLTILWQELGTTQKNRVLLSKLNDNCMSAFARAKVKASRKKLIEQLIANDNAELVSKIFACINKISIDEIDEYIQKASNAVQVTAFLIAYKNDNYTAKEQETLVEDKFNKELGIVERTPAEWKKIFSFKTEPSGITIKGYSGEDATVFVPQKIGDGIVTAIAEYAFSPMGDKLSKNVKQRRSDIVTVSIPNGVKKIGFGAFMVCSRLKSVELPDSITTIASDAFCKCAELNTIQLPRNINRIGKHCFFGCTQLQTLTIPNKVKTIDKFAFSECINLTSIVIPESVTSIADSAFNYCSQLTIHAPAGSYAETYAKENNIPFVAE